MSRPYFSRLLTSTALPFALMAASVAGLHAEVVTVPTVPGSLDGANGADSDTGQRRKRLAGRRRVGDRQFADKLLEHGQRFRRRRWGGRRWRSWFQ